MSGVVRSHPKGVRSLRGDDGGFKALSGIEDPSISL